MTTHSYEYHRNLAGARLAFARFMGWNDWDFAEEGEEEEHMVRGWRVLWNPDHNPASIVIPDDGDDDARFVLVTGKTPRFAIHDGWMTLGDARRLAGPIGEG